MKQLTGRFPKQQTSVTNINTTFEKPHIKEPNSVIYQTVSILPSFTVQCMLLFSYKKGMPLMLPFAKSFPYGSADKESSCNVGDLGSVPGLGRSPGEGKGYPLHYSGLENSMDCIVHGVPKSQTRLRDFHFEKSSHL